MHRYVFRRIVCIVETYADDNVFGFNRMKLKSVYVDFLPKIQILYELNVTTVPVFLFNIYL